MYRYLLIILFVCLCYEVSNASQPSSFYFLKSTGIVCVTTPCPSWEINLVNSQQNSITVHGLNFAPSVNETKVFEAKEDERILYGYWCNTKVNGQDAVEFKILGAHRMIAIDGYGPPRAGDYLSLSYYQWKWVNFPFITGPIVSPPSNPFLDYPHMDKEWLRDKLYNQDKKHRAIVQATVDTFGKVLVTAIFVSLDDPEQPCPGIVLIGCDDAHVMTFNRDANRCVSFDTCVEPGACILSIPVCPKGYNLVSIPSRPYGCPKHFCDPDFLNLTWDQ
ncbi:hypothetical protein SAMD00019534_002470, partial [Acytostelium subglobosum LB1]|uniref:hypothetical protein n=1 Tax=Acytostelium subglobosum LB1 TaxID=1410327 RepID=UPI000644ACE6